MTSPFARAWRHPSFALGALLVGLLAAAALLSLAWSPYPPGDIDVPNKFAPPCYGATCWATPWCRC